MTSKTLRARRGAAALLVAAALGVPAVAVPASASPATFARTTTTTAPATTTLDQASREVVAAGAVGHLAYVDDGRRVTALANGLADRATGRALRPDDQFEVGSNTKTFMSVLALQLVARGELRLDDSVEKLLPGVVPNGDKITLKMLLQHTSGLFNYTADEEFFGKVLADPTRRWTAEQLVAVATAHEPLFAPGTSWSYSNTNYVLVGMIIEHVSKRRLPDLVRTRIAQPLGLHRTRYVRDAVTETGPGYAHGYTAAFSTTPPTYTDVSAGSIGSWGNAAGAIVSTPRELATFFAAVLGGRLLPPAQLAQMKTTVRVPADFGGVDGGYGLGLMTMRTPCGTVWGHGGDTIGHHSTAVASADGRRAAVTDTTTQPAIAEGLTPGAETMIEASKRAELAATCAMYGKPLPRTL